MNSYLSEFIKNNTDIINNDEMDLVYSKCLLNERGKLTSLLIDAGIPVMDLFKDTIPESFLEGAELDSIKLPNNIKTIDTRGFFESKLKRIELNNNLEKICFAAFSRSRSLESIKIPDSVTTFEDCILFECSSLQSVELPSNMKVLPKGMFEYCTSLEKIELPETVERISSFAFYSCKNLKSITLPKNLEIIGYNAFTKTGLKSITIPEGVIELNSGVFSGCRSLEEAYLPKTLKRCMSSIFADCRNLATIYYDVNADEDEFIRDYVRTGAPFDIVYRDKTVHVGGY